MRLAWLLLLGAASCRGEAPLWLAPPSADELVFVLTESGPDGLEIVGRFGPADDRLRFTPDADDARAIGLSFSRAGLEAVSPRLDPNRWAELELELGAESCPRRAISEDLERRPLPPGTSAWALDQHEAMWRPVELDASVLARLSIVVPTDPSLCGAGAPVLTPFGAEPAVLLDGFEAYGRRHFALDPVDDSAVFQLKSVLATPDGGLVAVSNRYAYFLTEGRSLDVARPGEVFAASDVPGLPEPIEWGFAGAARIPGDDTRYLVGMSANPSRMSAGAIAQIETSSVGIRSISLLGLAPKPLEAVAVTASGEYVGVGAGVLVTGRLGVSPPRPTGLLAGVSLRLVAVTGRSDYPFVVADASGAIALVAPQREVLIDLTPAGFSSGTVTVVAHPGPPSRVEALRYSAQLVTVVELEPPTVSLVPMPPSLANCASASDVCEPHVLGQDPGALFELRPREFVVAPRRCSLLLEWQPERDCFFGWRATPDAPENHGFKGFEELDHAHGRFTASGHGGVVYQTVHD